MSASDGAAAAAPRDRFRTAALSVALLVFVALVLHRGGIPVLPAEGALARTDPRGVGVFVVLLLVHLVTRYGRHYFLLEPVARVPLARLIPVNAIGMAFITFLPFRLGEVARPAMLAEKGRLSLWAVAGTISAERLLDGVMYGALLAIGLVVAPAEVSVADRSLGVALSAHVLPHLARVVCLAFTGALVALVFFRRHRARARRSIERVFGAVSVRFAERVGAAAEQVSEGLRALESPRHALPYLALSAFAIFAHVVALDRLSVAVGLPALGLGRAAVVLGVLALGFAVPNAPGFFGAVQLALYAGLALYLPAERVLSEGAAFVFVFYATYVGGVLALAVLSLAVESARRRG